MLVGSDGGIYQTNNSVWKSTDGGRTFGRVTNGAAEPGSSPGYFARLAMDPSDPLRLWVASYSFFRTDNGAARWSRTNGPVGAPFAVVSPTDSNYVMAGDYRSLHFTSNGLDEQPIAAGNLSWPGHNRSRK